MVGYRPTKFVMMTSILGTSIGGIVLFKEYFGGQKYDGPERIDGKTVIITGANTGIGKETARELARRGGKIIMACRDMKKCKEARKDIVLDTKNKEIRCELCDLSSLSSIREFAQNIKQCEKEIHILINNAGVMHCPKTLTKEGFEMQIGVNHLGHFLLTNLLLDLLKEGAPSRIINVSSVAHVRGEINFNDVNSDKHYDKRAAYDQSKLANILFTTELARRLEGTGVTVNALHPGIVYTEIGRHLGLFNSIISKAILSPFLWLLLKTPRQGAQCSIYCALSPDLEKVSGKYLSNCNIQEPAPQAVDPMAAQKLWILSEQWTRLNQNFSLKQ